MNRLAGIAIAAVVLDANPLDSILNTRKVSRVSKRGGMVDRAALARNDRGQLDQ